ncbi:uncharacterized protein LOC112431523 isoform X2 [Maylandia zebra]|uniref:uncharacterized protein LOC112431523 isoform X2 n=1 Tax=Maylandia zebra TaxID=106582 RepID=UPI00403C2511
MADWKTQVAFINLNLSESQQVTMMRETDRVWLRCWQFSLQSTGSVSFQARIDECHRAVTKFVVKALHPFATADAPDFC